MKTSTTATTTTTTTTATATITTTTTTSTTATATTTTITTEAQSMCPNGFKMAEGDIPGWGQIKGKISTTYFGCGQECAKNQGCCSFEYSSTEKLCNLNSGCKPTVQPYKDYKFCIKEGRGSG